MVHNDISSSVVYNMLREGLVWFFHSTGENSHLFECDKFKQACICVCMFPFSKSLSSPFSPQHLLVEQTCYSVMLQQHSSRLEMKTILSGWADDTMTSSEP